MKFLEFQNLISGRRKCRSVLDPRLLVGHAADGEGRDGSDGRDQPQHFAAAPLCSW